jgi:tetratricopeptide (TPR) repeat protein
MTTLSQAMQRAREFYAEKEWDRSELLCRLILDIQSDYFDALNLLGAITAQSQRADEAVRIFARAVSVQPNNPATYKDLGLALKELKRHDEAITCYDRAIAIHADNADAYHNRGLALQELKRLDEALASYDSVIAIEPNHTVAHYCRGLVLKALQRPADALASYDRAISTRPDFFEAYLNRGIILKETGRLDEALASYDRAIIINPENADAYSNRGNALQELMRFDDAVASYDQALEFHPAHPDAHGNRGNALMALKRPTEALTSYDRAIEIRPANAEIHCNRGVTLKELERLDEALASFDQAIAIHPDYADAYFNKSLALLLSGEFKKGWAHYEWRWRRQDNATLSRNFTEPQWQGTGALKGKTVLLHSEQGLGDSIQFSRFASLVNQLGAKVILEVERPLLGLLRQLDGVEEVFEKGEKLPVFDYHCPLMSLPLAFGTELHTIPTARSYLSCPKLKIDAWAVKLGKQRKPRVGVVWSGGLATKMQSRNIPLALFVKILIDDFEWISLHKEVRDTDRAALAENPSLRHFGDEQADLLDAAALCMLVDWVVTVDTSIAHLAGALGRPVFILLPYLADWRWLLDREDSPWYPTSRLYRQATPGDWDSVLLRVLADLKELPKPEFMAVQVTEH